MLGGVSKQREFDNKKHSRWGGWGLWLGFFCGVWLCCGGAHAQKKEEFEQEARKAYAQGLEWEKAGKLGAALIKYKSALGLFVQAGKVLKSAQARQEARLVRYGLMCVVADAYRKKAGLSKDKDDARTSWRGAYQYYRDCEQGFQREQVVVDEQKAKASAEEKKARLALYQKKLDLMKKKVFLGLPQVKPNFSGQVVVLSEPSGAAVRLRDRWGRAVRGKTPLRETLYAGAYEVAMALPGRLPLKGRLVVKPGVEVKETFRLRLKPASLEIMSKPLGAQVTLTRKGQDPIRGVTRFSRELPAGRYEVTIELDAHQTLKETIELEPGQRLQRRFTLMKKVDDPRRRFSADGAPKTMFQYRIAMAKYNKKRSGHAIKAWAGWILGVGFVAIGVGVLVGRPESLTSSGPCEAECIALGSIALALAAGMVAFGIWGTVDYFTIKKPKKPTAPKSALRGISWSTRGSCTKGRHAGAQRREVLLSVR